jgi:cytochrome oxidase assembly protein ShyY1
MYRFLLRPAWIGFHLLVIGAVVVMANLGFWQLRRLDERKEFNSSVSERSEQPPVPLEDLLADPDFDPADNEWRQVTVAGDWLDPQVLVFNRTQGGRAGDNVLTALADDGGKVVLVNRGFVALGDDIPDAPATETAVLGRVRVNQSRQRGGLTDTSDTDDVISEVRRVEIDRLAPQYGGSVAPVYLDLIASEPAVGPTDPIPVPAPELGEGNHLSYAFQWFIFAVCVAIGWGLAVRRSVGARRAAAQ